MNQAVAAPASGRYSGQYGGAPNAATTYRQNQVAGPPAMNAGQAGTPGMTSPAADSYPSNPYMLSADARQSAAPALAGPAQQTMPQQSPQAPAGRLPVALDGYCAVSLEKESLWVPGDTRWGVLHEGRTYLFAGPAEQQSFLNNPNYYAPVLSGNDVVAHVERGQQVQGVRNFGARWLDRVYLFGSQENFDKFQANPKFYAGEILRPEQAIGSATPSDNRNSVGARANSGYGYY
jgi:protein disulfide-isomerase